MSADADELGGTMTATTPDATTTVRLLLEAFLTGDVETVMSYVDDDIEWNPAEHHPFLTQPMRGRQQYMNGLATVADVLDGFRLDIQRVHACGDVAVQRGVLPRYGQEHRPQLRRASRDPLGRSAMARWYSFASTWTPGRPTTPTSQRVNSFTV